MKRGKRPMRFIARWLVAFLNEQHVAFDGGAP